MQTNSTTSLPFSLEAQNAAEFATGAQPGVQPKIVGEIDLSTIGPVKNVTLSIAGLTLSMAMPQESAIHLGRLQVVVMEDGAGATLALQTIGHQDEAAMASIDTSDGRMAIPVDRLEALGRQFSCAQQECLNTCVDQPFHLSDFSQATVRTALAIDNNPQKAQDMTNSHNHFDLLSLAHFTDNPVLTQAAHHSIFKSLSPSLAANNPAQFMQQISQMKAMKPALWLDDEGVTNHSGLLKQVLLLAFAELPLGDTLNNQPSTIHNLYLALSQESEQDMAAIILPNTGDTYQSEVSQLHRAMSGNALDALRVLLNSEAGAQILQRIGAVGTVENSGCSSRNNHNLLCSLLLSGMAYKPAIDILFETVITQVGPNAISRNLETSTGCKLINKAVGLQDRILIDLLLKHGCNYDSNFALNIAADAPVENRALVEHLLAKGFDATQSDALHYATGQGFTEIAGVLLAHGAPPNGLYYNSYFCIPPPLHTAIEHGRTDIVNLLLDHNADINRKTQSGKPPLCHALRKGHRDIVQNLLERGADMMLEDTSANYYGQDHNLTTGLHLAINNDLFGSSNNAGYLDLMLAAKPDALSSLDQKQAREYVKSAAYFGNTPLLRHLTANTSFEFRSELCYQDYESKPDHDPAVLALLKPLPSPLSLFSKLVKNRRSV